MSEQDDDASEMNEAKVVVGMVLIPDHLDSIRGDHLEMQLQGRIHGLLSGNGLFRIRVVRAKHPSVALPDFMNRVDDAFEKGIITAAGHKRLMDTDLIVMARRHGSSQDVYMALKR